MNAALLPLASNKRLEAEARFFRLLPIVERKARWMRTPDEEMLSVGTAKLWQTIVERDEVEDAFHIASARNAMIDHLRRRNVRFREKRLAEICGEEEIEARASMSEVDKEDLLYLLTPRQRRAFRLHCLMDYTLEETGTKLGISVRTVCYLIARARNRLRLEME